MRRHGQRKLRLEVAQKHIEEFEECLLQRTSPFPVSGNVSVALLLPYAPGGSFKKIAKKRNTDTTTITPTAGALWPLNRENEVTARGSVGKNEACQGVLAEQKLAELMVLLH